MSKFSKLIESEIADFFAASGGPGEPDIHSGEAQRQLTERLLSVLALRERAEPVAEVCEGFNLRYIGHGPAPKSGLRIGAKLYTAPPAPVVPDCLQRLLKHAEGLTFGSDWNNGTAAKYHRDALIQAVKDCRAAMLQGAESASQQTSDEHVRREYRMEGSIWVQCSKQEYDRKKAAGREVRELYERPQNAQQNIPENIPDGWIKCSERMPEEGGRYWCYVEEINSLGRSHYQWNCSWNGVEWGGEALSGRVTHWMPLPAAPGKEG